MIAANSKAELPTTYWLQLRLLRVVTVSLHFPFLSLHRVNTLFWFRNYPLVICCISFQEKEVTFSFFCEVEND